MGMLIAVVTAGVLALVPGTPSPPAPTRSPPVKPVGTRPATPNRPVPATPTRTRPVEPVTTPPVRPARTQPAGLLIRSLGISVPASRGLGSAAPGGSLSAQLGTVKVTDTDLGTLSWTATVTATQFTTGTGTPAERIPASALSYWSGPETARTGVIVTITPGQPTAAQAQNLGTARTAFTVLVALGGHTVSWNPTVVLSVPPEAVGGGYTGTVTHSVA